MKPRRIVIAVVQLLVAMGYVGCSSDPPNKPVVEQEHPFYFVSDDNAYYRFHPLSEQVDTVTLPYKVMQNITVSADGKRLYIPNSNSTVVVSKDSFQFITELPYPTRGGVAVSPDGKLVAIQGTDLKILSTSDYSVVYSDTVGASKGIFSANSKSFYGLGGGVVFRLDPYTGVKSFKESFAPYVIWTAVPSNDESKLMLSENAFICTGHFLVYDVVKDSMIFDYPVSPGPNRIVVAPDGRYAFVTIPAQMQQDCYPPPSLFLMYDIGNNVIHKEVSIEGLFGDSVCRYCIVDAMAISPDSKTLVLCPWQGWGDFLIFDLPTETITTHHLLTRRWLISATCQTAQ